VKTTPKPRATKKSRGDELPPWLVVLLLLLPLFWVGGRFVLVGAPLAVVSGTEDVPTLAVSVMGVADGVADTISLTMAEVSAVAVSAAWRATTLIPSATAGCRRAMVNRPSYSKKHGGAQSIKGGGYPSVVECRWSRHAYISFRPTEACRYSVGGARWALKMERWSRNK